MDRLSGPGRIGRPRPIRVRYLIVFALVAYYFAFLSKVKRKWNKVLKKHIFLLLTEEKDFFRDSKTENIEAGLHGFNYYYYNLREVILITCMRSYHAAHND